MQSRIRLVNRDEPPLRWLDRDARTIFWAFVLLQSDITRYRCATPTFSENSSTPPLAKTFRSRPERPKSKRCSHDGGSTVRVVSVSVDARSN